MHNLQIRLRTPGQEKATPEAFEVVEGPRPTIRSGQFLCRARWLSVESSARTLPGSLLAARGVAEVIESRHDVFTVGECVELEHGMQLLQVSDGSRAHHLRPGQNPLSTALGPLGNPGLTAYFGLLEAARLQPNETVLVSGAAGGVGSMVGQIAMLKGARAIGIASSRETHEWVTRVARFTGCVDRHRENLHERLRALAPRGVHVFFDTVGSPVFETVMANGHLAPNVRVVSCVEPPPGNGRVNHVSAESYDARRDEFLREAIAWHGEQLLVYREDVAQGLENAPAHFVKRASGEAFGHALVKV
jgi:NADPH-dependent curcumin reductase